MADSLLKETTPGLLVMHVFLHVAQGRIYTAMTVEWDQRIVQKHAKLVQKVCIWICHHMTVVLVKHVVRENITQK